ncbi:recombinase family protein [Ammoniphilus sp. YIM 78166]|uniref:recombinase family protein n=1 Tax=Ammoniphilus sp. YIM 78166 TaxID=1644106 RepID=UPI00142F9C88|nr:recombinase family protein [Ammoniphilus sp. YIM 78166]
MELTPKVKLAALYLRRSRQDVKLEARTGENTLEAQRMAMKKFLSRAGFPYHTFEEIASGSSLEKRREMKRIIEGIKKEKYDAIIVKDISRLSRGSQQDAGILYKIIEDYEILIITPARMYDPKNESDLQMLRFEFFFYHEEFQAIKKRLTSGRQQAAERGFYIGGPIPYGWKVDQKTKTLIPDEEQKKVIHLMYDLYLEERYGFQKIADELNRRKIPAPKGGKWAKASIKRILSNERNIGMQVFGKRKKRGGKVKFQPKELWTIVESTESLVNEERFNRVQERLQDNKVSYLTDSHRRAHPLSKLIKCGACGKVMYRKHTKSYYTRKSDGVKNCYSFYILHCCNGSVKYDRVLQKLTEILKTHIDLDTNALSERLEHHAHHQKETNKMEDFIVQLEQRIEKIKQHRLTLYEEYAEKKSIDQFIYEAKNKQYVKQIQELEKTIEETDALKHKKENDSIYIDPSTFKKRITSIIDTFESLEPHFQNELLHYFFKSLKLHITKRTVGKESEFELDIVFDLNSFG